MEARVDKDSIVRGYAVRLTWSRSEIDGRNSLSIVSGKNPNTASTQLIIVSGTERASVEFLESKESANFSIRVSSHSFSKYGILSTRIVF